MYKFLCLILFGIVIFIFDLSGQNNPEIKKCTDCHATIIANKNIHIPVEESCEICHESDGTEHPNENVKGFALTEEMPQLCFNCHDDVLNELTAKFIHPPFEDDCRNCHDVHSSVEDHLLIQKTTEVCYNCHDDLKMSVSSLPMVHKAIDEKRGCMNCHSPHASSNEKYLIAETKELCLSCHNKAVTTESKNLTNIKQLLKSSKVIHGAIEVDGCLICHTAHASKYSSLLVSNFPVGDYAPAQPDSFALCFSCHDAQMLAEEVTNTATNFRNGNQNLHYLHINGNKGRNCKVCHDMHGSQNEHLIASVIRFGNWEMPLNFSSLQNGGACLTGCHSEKKYNWNQFIANNPTTTLNLSDTNIESITKIIGLTNEDSVLSNTATSYEETGNIKLQEIFNKIQLPSIKFIFNKTLIVEGTDKNLMNVVDFLKKYPGCKIEIAGHADSLGENAYNLVLSIKRAEKVKQILVSYGVGQTQIITKGYGASIPLESNKTKKGRANNRRAEFNIVN